MSELTGTFTCPLCGRPIHVTITLSTVLIEIESGPSFTAVAAPQYTHTCPPHGNAAAPDG